MANALGMHVIAFDPLVPPQEAESAGAIWADLEFLVESADFVSLHAPARADSPPMFDERMIKKMKATSVLINTASAELIDHVALGVALSEKRIGGAALDILPTHPVEPNFPLLGLENVIITPHIGGATVETIRRHSQMITEDLLRFTRGEMPVNFVNPEVWSMRRGTT